MFHIIEGGVCAAKGFQAGAVRCGIKETSEKDDTAVIVSENLCAAAAVYTRNRVKAAPLQVTREHLEDGKAQVVIINSGNANACAPDGLENARREAAACGRLLGIDEKDVVVCSTGVIGVDPFRGRKRGGSQSHHDHGHSAEDHGGGVYGGRSPLPPGRHLQGLRHDSPQHGYHALHSHHGLRRQ